MINKNLTYFTICPINTAALICVMLQTFTIITAVTVPCIFKAHSMIWPPLWDHPNKEMLLALWIPKHLLPRLQNFYLPNSWTISEIRFMSHLNKIPYIHDRIFFFLNWWFSCNMKLCFCEIQISLNDSYFLINL